LSDVLSAYNEGQIENDESASMLYSGLSGTGKGHTSGWAKEHALAGDHAKLFELHASKTSHLAEIFQFMLPNGFFLNRESRRILESVKTELEKGSYREPELGTDDIDELLDLLENGSPPERMEKIDEFLDREENHTLCQRLQDAREKQEEIQERLMQIHKWGYTNDEIPDLFRKNYTDSRNDSFNVKVFTPISRNMPTCEVPDFFEPFGVPADAFERYEELGAALKVIHPDRFEQYKNFYGRVVKIGDTSLQDLKNVDELNESDHYIEREFGNGQTYRDTRVRNEKNIREKFQRDWDGTFTEGVACSSDFEYKLRGRLKEAMLDDDVDIITLYTGFLSDHTLRKFVITYFMEIMFDIARNLSGKEVRDLDRMFIGSMIEAQDVVEISTKENSLTSSDRVFNKYLWQRLNDARHENFNFWFDTKPAQTHKLLLSKIPRRVITRLNKEDRQSWYQSPMKSQLKDAFDSSDYTSMDGSYPEFGTGFIYNDDFVEWEDKHGRQRYGHRLPCPRMCVHDPVDEFSNDDWSFFIEELGMDSMRFEPFQEALFNEDWEKNAEPYIEESKRKEEEKKKEEEQEEQDKRQILVDNVRSKMREKVNAEGEIPSSWTEKAREILDELHEKGMAQDWEVPRNVMDVTQDMRDNPEKHFDLGSSDLDIRQLAEEAVRIEEAGQPIFVYSATSKPDKENLVERYLVREHGLDEGVAEDKAEKVVSEAVTRILKPREVIGGSHQVIGEFKDSPERFWEEFGRSVRDSSDQAGSKEEEVNVEKSPDEAEDVEEDTEDESVEGVEEAVEADSAMGDADSEVDSSEDEPEAPGGEWMCTCGQFNEADRAVCGNPKCLKSYEEVEEETQQGSD
jgi:hypothetical protein